jgi:hypothetical protein
MHDAGGEDSKGNGMVEMGVCGRSRDAVIDGVIRLDVMSEKESGFSCFGIV